MKITFLWRAGHIFLIFKGKIIRNTAIFNGVIEKVKVLDLRLYWTYNMLQSAVAIYILINIEVQFQYVKKSTSVWYETVKILSLGYLMKVP